MMRASHKNLYVNAKSPFFFVNKGTADIKILCLKWIPPLFVNPTILHFLNLHLIFDLIFMLMISEVLSQRALTKKKTKKQDNIL